MASKRSLPKRSKARALTPKRRSYWPLYLAAGALALIVVGVLILPGTFSSGNSAQVTGQPRLAVDREQIDFGKVPLGKTVRATFQISNIGDQPLQILGEPVVELKEGC